MDENDWVSRLKTHGELLRELWKERSPDAQAKSVFEELESFLALDESKHVDDEFAEAFVEQRLVLDAVIEEKLNSDSIWAFVELAARLIESKRASINAQKRHAENRAMKADVFEWLDAHMRDFKSMDGAAEAIAGKVAPIAFRTAREWVGQWKKLRSASTP